MSIDEAIEDLKECDSWQVAEWLEELKAYKEIGTVEELTNSVLMIEKAYNKALDDVLKLAHEDVTTGNMIISLADVEKLKDN